MAVWGSHWGLNLKMIFLVKTDHEVGLWNIWPHMSRDMTKPTNWHVCPAKTQISLGIRPVWSVFPVRMRKPWVLSYPVSPQWRIWSDWADAQADLSLCWAHSHFVGFVMRRLKFSLFEKSILISQINESQHYFKSFKISHFYWKHYHDINFAPGSAGQPSKKLWHYWQNLLITPHIIIIKLEYCFNSQ